MPRIAYLDKRFRASTLETIERADGICRQYAAQGLTLTLRQIYYQHVARGWLANKQTNYDNLGATLNDARLAGQLDWSHMEDRTRYLRSLSTWESPASILATVAAQYKRDVWATQSVHVECWIEKDALVGVIERPCEDERIGYFACRGYPSQSEIWAAAMRYVRHIKAGKRVVILHLGDHDPSGIDMTRDIEDRLTMFIGAHAELYQGQPDPNEGHRQMLTVDRLALNMDQVETYNPPPNPAKLTDSRATDYIARFGSSSWELDALEPSLIGSLITDAVAELRDPVLWHEALVQEADELDKLYQLSESYDYVAGLI